MGKTISDRVVVNGVHRPAIEAAIATLIEVLDILDGDADLEDNGDAEPDADGEPDDEDTENDCDREDGGDAEPDADAEPSLGAPEPVTADDHGDGGQISWARGLDDDREATGTLDDMSTYAPFRSRASAEALWAIERDARALASRLRHRRRPVKSADRHGELVRATDGRLGWLLPVG